jgi:digeranylgeranylglycerophospholipid reductase
MKDAYDVIVVGAGPAGSVAARFAAEGGASVLLIEKRQEIGDPVRCAEGVGAIDLDKYLDIEPRFVAAPIKGAIINIPGGDPIKMRSKDESKTYGYILERKIFDRALAERAARAGVDVYTKTTATGLIMKDGRVAGVKVERLGVEKEIEANIVIGADGVESKVGRWAGIDTTLKPSDIESGIQYLMTDIDIDEENVEIFMGHQNAPGGYVWIFPKGPGRANVGIGLLGSKIKDGARPVDFLNAFVEKRFPTGKIIEINYGGIPVSGGQIDLYRAGLMLVGDAGHLSNPVTGGGIKNGLWSGELAGLNAAQAVREGDFSEKSMKRYQKAWQDKGGKAMKRDLILKEYYISMTDEEAIKIAQALKDVDFTDVLDISQLAKILMKVDKKLLLKLGANQLGL